MLVVVSIFYIVCLFAGNVHYELLFSMTLAMLWCFYWMHFWWYGFVCTSDLMDVDQGVEYENNKKSCLGERGGFLLQVLEMCSVDKSIWNSKEKSTRLSVLLCTIYFLVLKQ